MKGEPIKAAALFLITLKSPKDAREILVSTKKGTYKKPLHENCFRKRYKGTDPFMLLAAILVFKRN